MSVSRRMCAASSSHTSGVRAAAQSLSRRYRQGEKNPDGANLLRSETEIAAYAAFRMPATYAALVTALRMAEESGCGEMRTLTDVGAGSGSAYWAVREVFGEPERAVLVERESTALKREED